MFIFTFLIHKISENTYYQFKNEVKKYLNKKNEKIPVYIVMLK